MRPGAIAVERLRFIAWWVLVGAAAGAIAGFFLGGIGGRLAMLVLRLTSPDYVIGMTSDDGFEIGVVSTDTFQLVLGMTALGGINGVLYAAVRSAIPSRLRLVAWSVLWALAGGAAVVHDDGIDFLLLEPAWLAIALFVGLPGLAAALVVVLVERWTPVAPWQDRRLAIIVLVGAAASTFALVAAVVVGAIALALGSSERVSRLVRLAGSVLVPVAVVAVAVLAGMDLLRDTDSILD
jgi:hypothetical protein